MSFEKQIAELILKTLDNNEISVEEIENSIEIPKDMANGDFAFPCFKLSKTLKKSPVQIADDIKEKIVLDDSCIDKIENVNGFLNFYISKNKMVSSIVEKFNNQKEKYGSSNIGNGRNVVIDFSSPNIAKPFHIGHLKTTIIGHCLYNVYKFLGFNLIGDNHLGDYGTQFAKLIIAYDKWGSEYDFSENPIDKLAELYVRINQLCEEDEEVLELCRETFKKLEDGDPHCVEIWTKFKDLSLIEFNEIYDLLGVKFDTMYGEAFYSDLMPEVLDILEKSGGVTESKGAKIIDLSDEGIDTPFLIQKANGSSIYATRDLATLLFRVREYDYYKNLYVVGKEQSLYFKQLFAASKYLGIDKKYSEGCEHVSYGLIRLPEGKMSSRKGNFVKVKDLLDESISKVKEIVKDREIENKDEVAKQIGIGAIVFDNLKDTTVKDQVFDINAALNFTGETGPYIQYTTVRTNSVIEKLGNEIPKLEDVNIEKLTDDASMSVLKTISEFPNTVVYTMKKNEPSYIARYLLKLSKKYSNFYNNNKIICNDKELQDARLYLTYMTNITLKNGLDLLGIEVPTKM